MISRALKQGVFQFRSLEEAYQLADFLSAAYPDPNLARLGMTELFINAIEHGNLGITSIEKTSLQDQNQWLSEIAKRLTLAPYRHKKVTVLFKQTGHFIKLIVRDEGKGFNWKKLLEEIKQKTLNNQEQGGLNISTHGRGILMVKQLVFNRLTYSKKGNEVMGVVKISK